MIDAIVIAGWTLDGTFRAAGSPISLTEEAFADFRAKGFVRAAAPEVAAAPSPRDLPTGWVGRVKAAQPVTPGVDDAETITEPQRPTERRSRKGRA